MQVERLQIETGGCGIKEAASVLSLEEHGFELGRNTDANADLLEASGDGGGASKESKVVELDDAILFRAEVGESGRLVEQIGEDWVKSGDI